MGLKSAECISCFCSYYQLSLKFIIQEKYVPIIIWRHVMWHVIDFMIGTFFSCYTVNCGKYAPPEYSPLPNIRPLKFFHLIAPSEYPPPPGCAARKFVEDPHNIFWGKSMREFWKKGGEMLKIHISIHILRNTFMIFFRRWDTKIPLNMLPAQICAPSEYAPPKFAAVYGMWWWW